MKKDLKFLIVTSLVISLLTIITIQTNIMLVNSSSEQQEQNIELNYIISGTIDIDEDQDFIDLGFPGDGSPSTPYLIEYLSITENYGISVFNTTMNFVIQHCFLSTQYNSIELLEIAPFSCTIVNNTFTQSGAAVLIDYADGVKIEGNQIYENIYGIKIEHSFDCTVQFNNISYNVDRGLRIAECRNTIIKNNTFTNDGLDVRNALDTDFMSHTIANNSVNEKQLGWFVNNFDKVISSDIYGQIYLVACDNVTITGLTLNRACISIFIAYSTMCNIIDCETSNNNVNGFQLYYSTYINIVNCNSSYNARYGFNLRDSEYTTITNSFAEYNGLSGLRCVSSHYSTIDSTIMSFNKDEGAWILADEVVLTNNVFEGNTYGIVLLASNLCRITNNQIIENTEIGLFCSGTSATIYGNYFIDNDNQAEDNGVNNVWFDISNEKGNWWSNWVSSPYNIPGSAGSVDYYPLNDPAVPEYNLTLTLSLTIALSLLLVMTVSIRRKK